MQMLCKKCGASVPDTTYECPFCKAKLGDEPVMQEEETTSVEEAVESEDVVADNEEIFDENEQKRNEQIKRMLDEKQQQLSEIQDRREMKRKKQQRNKIILVAVICVLVSIAVGSGAYFISNSANNSTNNKESVEISTPAPEATADPSATEEPLATVDPLPTIDPLASPEPTIDPAATPSPEAGQSWQAVDPETGAQTGTVSGNSSSGTTSSGTAAPTGSSGTTSSGTTGSTNSSGSSGKTGSSNKSTSTGKTSSTGNTSSTGKASSSNKTSSTTKPSGTATKIVNTGITKKNLSGMVAKGGKVVQDSASGKYVMTFISDGTEYFAYVSEGSTTAQVENKTLGITAVPTENTYKGSTVYEISNLIYFEGDYILKDSGTRLLTEADVAGMSKAELGYARNEIFARHGRPFKTAKYKEYFAKCSWYKINPGYNLNDDKSNLNKIERANVDFIIAQENK